MLPHDEKGCSVIAIGNANTGPDRARSTPRGVDRKTVPGPDLQHWKWTKPWGLHTGETETLAYDGNGELEQTKGTFTTCALIHHGMRRAKSLRRGVRRDV